MQVISTLGELAAKIQECNDALTHGSDDAMRRVFGTFQMDFSKQLPADPFSPEYRDFQMSIYQHVAQKPYSVANERTLFDVDAGLRRPFPYCAQSCMTAGHHLTAIGFMLRTLDLQPGARVLEFGPGYGNTTIALALLGMEVTAVDIEPNFCELIRARAAQNFADVEVVQADFLWAETVTEPYDAVIFFECFHHCADHMRLLAALHTAVKPGGHVTFASEPILPGYPVPWGVRMDGEALWAARNFGWMELGFDEAYFAAALRRTGWSARKHICPDVPWASVWQARRADAALHVAAAPFDTAPIVQEPPPERTASELSLAREIEALHRSTSWRITAPLRALKRLMT